MNELNAKPLEFWCQFAIPLVYDDSLSYYEAICKVGNYANENRELIIELAKTIDGEFSQKIKDYIDKRFNDIMLDTMYVPETETLRFFLKKVGE